MPLSNASETQNKGNFGVRNSLKCFSLEWCKFHLKFKKTLAKIGGNGFEHNWFNRYLLTQAVIFYFLNSVLNIIQLKNKLFIFSNALPSLRRF